MKICKINSASLSSSSLLNSILPPKIPVLTIWCLVFVDKGLNKRILYVRTNLYPEVVFKIQMKVCQTVFVTCLFTLNVSFIFFTWWMDHFLLYCSLIVDNWLLTAFRYYKQYWNKHPSLGVVKSSDIGVRTPEFESLCHLCDLKQVP